ncbi:Holliday junction branch migration protein RuvA [Limisalsivibrio acetivorans]|uniref:Holliday junction branch migration protein RuvA n=1 Tax=Limisalsivibrio acetivorans TaxID=1304888 RepID=UPI001EE365D1|nr:Holliday junction branch migration protein RuvA [Limisalsivibrio acetivorans]
MVKGKLIEKTPESAVIDTGGVAYEVGVSMQTFAALPEKGEDTALFTILNVREDNMSLFGFLNMEEKKLFQQLTSISKVGPKLAMSVLSGLDTERFRQAVVNGDAARISSIPGIGTKTAERIILELKDKFHKVFTDSPEAEASGSEDIASALVNLGYSRKDADKMLRSFYDPALPFEENLKKILKELSG